MVLLAIYILFLRFLFFVPQLRAVQPPVATDEPADGGSSARNCGLKKIS